MTIKNEIIKELKCFYENNHEIFNKSEKEIKDFFTEHVKHNLKKVHPHALRHSNASILVASGQDIKTVSHRLGHANVSTTMNIYTHFIKAADANASDSLENILISPPQTE